MSDLIIDNKNKKRALGRGLGSLLGGASGDYQETPSAPRAPASPIEKAVKIEEKMTPQAEAFSVSPTPAANNENLSQQGKVWQLSIEKIQPGAYQPRKSFDNETLGELSQSIKNHGILQPLVVRKVQNGNFEIIAGERRWRAAQMAGLHEAPVLIKDFDHQKTLELSLIENIQREDLNPIDEAAAYDRLANEFKLSQVEIAERVGKDRATVANSMRLLQLPEEVKKYILEGLLSTGHAKVLLSTQDKEKMKSLGKKSIEGQWSVRKLEKEILQQKSEVSSTSAASIEANVTQKLIQGLGEELQKALGTKVTIDYSEGKGKLGIYYYSDEELTSLVEKLKAKGHR